jgi:hypothetical protein
MNKEEAAEILGVSLPMSDQGLREAYDRLIAQLRQGQTAENLDERAAMIHKVAEAYALLRGEHEPVVTPPSDEDEDEDNFPIRGRIFLPNELAFEEEMQRGEWIRNHLPHLSAATLISAAAAGYLLFRYMKKR